MDIKVTVDGICREVCGINDCTTCEEVILKLAQVASLPGFYTLVAKVQNKETTLSPDEKVISFLQSTKENVSKVRFILRRLEAPSSPFTQKSQQQQQQHQTSSSHSYYPMRSCSKSRRQPQLNAAEMKDFLFASHKLANTNNAVSNVTNINNQFNVKNCHHSPNLNTNQPVSSVIENTNEYNELKDQLAYQEQQVELNRIRLMRLDKEILHLEQTTRPRRTVKTDSADSTVQSNPVAELTQLMATPWSQLLDTNRAKQRELLSEVERHKIAIDQVDSNLVKTKTNLTNLETQINDDLVQLLHDLESYNQFRRSLLHDKSSTTTRRISNMAEGVPV